MQRFESETDSDVWSILNSINKTAYWLSDQRFNLEPDFLYNIKVVSAALNEKNDPLGRHKLFFDNCSEMAVEATMIANQQNEGLEL